MYELLTGQLLSEGLQDGDADVSVCGGEGEGGRECHLGSCAESVSSSNGVVQGVVVAH